MNPDTKVIYRRYASLFFICAISPGDNELITLETIHRYVEVLDRYFGNVSSAASPRGASSRIIIPYDMRSAQSPPQTANDQVCELDLIFNFQKAYAILDELIIAGELQETSKKAVLRIVCCFSRRILLSPAEYHCPL